jgi:hypothetical protein
MKIRKLDARGFSHHFVMVLVVLVIAIGGTYYLVASHADNNCSPVSGVSAVSTPTSAVVCAPPGAPSQIGFSENPTARSVALNWAASTASTGDPVAGYYVYGISGYNVNAPSAPSAPTLYQTISNPNQLSATISNLNSGVTYGFYVQAYDSSSPPLISPHSPTVTVSVPPAAPLNVTATSISSSQIGLSWMASVGATGYIIYRNGNEITTTTAATSTSPTNYVDSGLSPSTTYSYYVIAFNSVGTKGQQSPPSNTTTATTKAVTVVTPPTPPSPPRTTSAAEQLSIPPQRRPVQYLGLCEVGKTGYVSSGTSNCWAGGTLLENYSPSVPGTYYDIPCVQVNANSAADRFVYIASGEVCPAATTAIPLQLLNGERVSFPPATRPASYLTVCEAGNIIYVALSSCVYRIPNTVYEFTYTPPQPGTYYSVPCATVTQGGLLRYLYVSNGESCPANTFGNLEQ